MSTGIINVLIVEDKLLIAEDIADKLRKHGLAVTGICTSGEEAIDVVKSTSTDLILLDIKLDGKLDGIATAEEIRRIRHLPIIYLSDYTDPKTIDRAKKTLPENYLSKPFSENDLVRSIELAFYNFGHRQPLSKAPIPDVVFLRTESQSFVKISIRDILFLEADRAYCNVVCKEKSYVLSTSMNHVAEQINNPNFIKVNRSYIINLDNIREFEGNIVKIGGREITMNSEGKELVISRIKFIK